MHGLGPAPRLQGVGHGVVHGDAAKIPVESGLAFPFVPMPFVVNL
jgi:hypothetical protein